MIETTLDSVAGLRDAVAATEFAMSPSAAAEAEAVADQIDDYILPRLANIDAPLLAVVGGSTGSGKSTLVNAIVGRQVSTSGVIRPTTRQPVLVANPGDSEWFNSGHVLPGLAREQGEAGANPSATSLRTVASEAVSPGLALLDAPDFDSIDDRNRALASQLLAAADLWVFVTTPSRYADQLVWNFLHDAAGRDIEVIVVLNRVDEDALATVPDDLRRMMAEAGLGQATLFTVPDHGQVEGLLPEELVAPLRGHLQRLAEDAAARRSMAAKTVQGALGSVAERVERLAVERQRQEEFGAQLGETFDGNYLRARDQVIDATSDGNLLRQEVLQRWQDFVGTSDAFRSIERWYSMAVDRIGSFFTGRPAPVREMETEIEAGLHAVVVDAAETAATRSWSHLGSAAPELRASSDPALAHADADINGQAAELVRQWQAGLVESIQETAGDKRKRARIMSLGLNVITVALMLVVFASTAGLTGGEIAIAGGSAVMGQKLLETIFGEDTVRRMARQAREDLDTRIHALLAGERARYDAVTARLTGGTTAARLREAVETAERDVRKQTGA
ncbi:dynamin family protein [Corynebacterium marinum]|uniref:ABC superfamily ATP binding cassette transporter n=2 Tax=Corynebacterium marinum TaxID=349751 RepID=A0A0B6TTD8_9CORY|nr:dynamin family protein [Corynebacterium marinum]AJK68016.1 ABC superfamily ATP binding cassette transporter [Corynebacterium marinum DSM 44953]GGO11233.1 ABC transporter [Corynebacterium marinum]